MAGPESLRSVEVLARPRARSFTGSSDPRYPPWRDVVTCACNVGTGFTNDQLQQGTNAQYLIGCNSGEVQDTVPYTDTTHWDQQFVFFDATMSTSTTYRYCVVPQVIGVERD